LKPLRLQEKGLGDEVNFDEKNFLLIQYCVILLSNQNYYKMKTKSLTLFFVLIFAIAGVSEAQVGRLLRNKINQAINKDAESKIDSVAADQQEESQTEGRRGLGVGLLGGKTDIPHAEEYDFTGRIYSVLETYNKKDVQKTDYYLFFNKNTPNAGMEMKIDNPDNKEQAILTKFIFDTDNRCFMMLMDNDGAKTGIISTIPDDSTMNAQTQKRQQVPDREQASITKTGNTKIIAGYRCDEYKVVEEGEEGYANVWMTKDIKINADKRNWGKTGMPTFYDQNEFEGSVMLAMDSYDKDNTLKMKMETKEINDNISHSISTAGYSFIKMNFGQAGKK
jgi:hypothetical protein